ncbi:hypothetical protein M404DRAFT_1004084 [Pisolithus tinctorius Marx 270]|uniref:Uncharacterized protein n=1 Tax=Pisolithus tinctorius Marx 270 TaxID=870435 RepID=A0A0C3NGH7_PISTI|nr:hypothetical protein M404DRAFT_1004084 [Pisolithus tinctorius Marx 270]
MEITSSFRTSNTELRSFFAIPAANSIVVIAEESAAYPKASLHFPCRRSHVLQFCVLQYPVCKPACPYPSRY